MELADIVGSEPTAGHNRVRVRVPFQAPNAPIAQQDSAPVS